MTFNKYSAAVTAVLFIAIVGVTLNYIWGAKGTKYDANSSGAGNKSEQIISKELNYVGAQACQNCHEPEFEQWRTSDHYRAMQLPNSDTVIGDFSDVKVNFHGIESRLYMDGDRYFIDTHNEEGKSQAFEIKYTFGHYPLQQYLVELDKGRLQALNIAWDNKAEEEGGGRWFHLQPDEKITVEHPFFWTKHFQNWNSRCADCHSTNLERNYDISTNSFSTTFSEVNVSCEACHGPASKHLEMAQQNALNEGSGFTNTPSEVLHWQFSADKDIAQPIGKKDEGEINMCGECHSLRSQLTKEASSGSFHQDNRIQLIDEAYYFTDGQSKEEAFVLGSFLQSKMHHKGVICRNCHNAHSGKLLTQGNGLCAQCHKSNVYDTPEHHHHQEDSEGAQCVNCHMPARTFMQVDNRRDHSFTIPRPDLSKRLSVPNACTQCHADKDNDWADQQTQKWGVKDNSTHWAHLLNRASKNDVLVTRSAVEAVLDTGLPELIRASLLSSLSPLPSRVSADAARKSLYDKSALVRRAAVTALRSQNAEIRWRLLSPYMTDPNRVVRMAIADTLADVVSQLELQDQSRLKALLDEYRESLAVSADSVSTQLTIANLELRLGNMSAAEAAFKHALTIESGFVPALLAFADFNRGKGEVEKEFALLERALEIAPDSGAVQHSLGLYFVRQKDYGSALEHLRLAIEQEDAVPYYAYVYSVALENQGQMIDAIRSLKDANQRWPNQYELLMTLILYLEKTGSDKEVLPYLSNLSAIAPSAPAVKQLIAKYQAKVL